MVALIFRRQREEELPGIAFPLLGESFRCVQQYTIDSGVKALPTPKHCYVFNLDIVILIRRGSLTSLTHTPHSVTMEKSL